MAKTKTETDVGPPMVFALHCDAILKAVHKNIHLTDDNAVSQVDVPKMRRGGVDGVTIS